MAPFLLENQTEKKRIQTLLRNLNSPFLYNTNINQSIQKFLPRAGTPLNTYIKDALPLSPRRYISSPHSAIHLQQLQNLILIHPHDIRLILFHENIRKLLFHLL